MTRRKSKDAIIEGIKNKHGSSIDLSEFKYVDKSTQCTFICGKCGNKWSSLPFLVARGNGCPRCDAMKVISKGKAKFGDKFSYDKTLESYSGMKKKCSFHCNVHDVDFVIEPLFHLSSKNGGCKKCANEDCSKRKMKTLDGFIRCSKSKFGDKFAFDKSIYNGNMSNITVTCAKHGYFVTTPKKFLSSEFGCEKCSRDARVILPSVWIGRFKRFHGDLYDYSMSVFGKTDDRIAITCKKHGVFYQTPHNHANGEGCPICGVGSSTLEKILSCSLNDSGIKYEAQKRFEWLGRMSLDFYIPTLRIAIECQGIQHYESVEFFGGVDKLEYVKNNDLIKYSLCSSNGIDLIYLCNKRNKDDSHNYGKKCFTNVNDVMKYIYNAKKSNE